jgi:bifunctional non-homologous end joining protein LigD
MPDWLVPMAATLTEERFNSADWLFERKYDGIRLLAYKRGANVSLYSRNRLPQHLPAIAGAIARLPVDDAIFDGEIEWHGSRYHVFDVLWLDEDVRQRTLEERRALLASLPLDNPLARVDLVTTPEPWTDACREGWEGVIAKRRTSVYEHRRSPHWLKMKCELTQSFVIGGFTDPQGARVALGALLVGHYRDGELCFAGKVGTGFDTKQLVDVRAALDRLEIPAPPFTKAVGLPRLRAHWVRPELVVPVSFIEWTDNGKLRHPRLVGMPAPIASVEPPA